MQPAKSKPLRPEVAAARQRVERWRATKRPGHAMPEELWTEAVSLADELGPYAAGSLSRSSCAIIGPTSQCIDQPLADPGLFDPDLRDKLAPWTSSPHHFGSSSSCSPAGAAKGQPMMQLQMAAEVDEGAVPALPLGEHSLHLRLAGVG